MSDNILITGAGGAAAIAFIKSMSDRSDLVIHAADMDPLAAGLYLVPAERRHIIPGGDAPSFAATLMELCRRLDIALLVPTVDVELLPLAQYADVFLHQGTTLLTSSHRALKTTLDKASLIRASEGRVPCPKTEIIDETFEPSTWPLPVIAKPRGGSGSRGIVLISNSAQWSSVPKDGSYIVQAYLPGAEYSVDVLATPEEHVLAAVPRHRLKVDSGVAVTAATVRDHELQRLSARVVSSLGLAYVNNVQWKRDADGVPRLLEINPRLPGTLPLTIASGVHMPDLCLRLWRRQKIALEALQFEPTAMVRTWEEHFVRPSAIEAMQADPIIAGQRVCA